MRPGSIELWLIKKIKTAGNFFSSNAQKNMQNMQNYVKVCISLRNMQKYANYPKICKICKNMQYMEIQ